MTQDDIRKVWQEAQENNAKLNACPGPHVFEEPMRDFGVGTRYACSKCGGTLRTEQRLWYERGLEHGLKA